MLTILCFLNTFFNFELGFHVAKDGLNLATQPRMTLNFQFSYSTSLVLRCQACTTIPGFEKKFIFTYLSLSVVGWWVW